MIKAGTLDLVATRWTPFVYTIDLVGINLTSATLKAEVRLKPDTPGTALVSLAAAISSAEGLSFTVDTSGTVPISTLQIRINETTIEGLPAPGVTADGEVGDDLVLYWDLHITPSGGTKAKYLKGTFTVEAGVTS